MVLRVMGLRSIRSGRLRIFERLLNSVVTYFNIRRISFIYIYIKLRSACANTLKINSKDKRKVISSSYIGQKITPPIIPSNSRKSIYIILEFVYSKHIFHFKGPDNPTKQIILLIRPNTKAVTRLMTLITITLYRAFILSLL